MERLIIWLIVLFVFFVLPGILQAMAKRRIAQQAQRRPREEDQETETEVTDEEEPGYAADPDDIREYLKSLGVPIQEEPARRAPPARQPVAPTRLAPAPAPSPTPPPVIITRPNATPRLDITRQQPPTEAHPAPPGGKHPDEYPSTQEGEWPQPEHKPHREEPVPGPPTSPHAPRVPVVAGVGPKPVDLRQAVILSEILRRPDFAQFPCDRELW